MVRGQTARDPEKKLPPEERLCVLRDVIKEAKTSGDLEKVTSLQIELMALTHLRFEPA